MTAPVSTTPPEASSPSRRAVLASALGAAAALGAALGRPTAVRAADGQTVLVGGEYTSESSTRFTNLTTSATVLWGQSSSGVGVRGTSSSDYGVYGISSSSVAVYGSSGASDQPASVGWAGGNSTGVQGVSGYGTLPAPRPKTGVYGNANQDIFASGVTGESPLGVGVRGKTTSGYAGYFEGRVYTNAFYELGEVAAPAAPLANRARLFVRDNGSGSTQLCVKFANGVVRVLATM